LHSQVRILPPQPDIDDFATGLLDNLSLLRKQRRKTPIVGGSAFYAAGNHY
jgi:hypothetical protein